MLHRSQTRTSAGRAAAVATLLLVTGCGSTSGAEVADVAVTAVSSITGAITSSTITSSTITSSTTTLSVTTPVASTPRSNPAGSTSTAGADPSAGAPLTVPVAMVSNSGDQAYLTVKVSIGGGAPATLWLDTGSSGILVNSSAVGSEVTTSTTPVGIDYTSGALVGSIATATVDIGGVATADPIAFALLDEQKSTFRTPPGTVGIMGIGTDDDSDVSTQQIFAPQLQLPAPYNAGSTMQLGSDGSGSWILSPVTPTADLVAVPLTPNTSSTAGVPAGYPALLRPVNLCWTIGTAASTCGPTDLDTGSPATLLSATDYAGLAASGDLLAAPTAIQMDTPDGATLWSFTSGTTDVDNAVGVDDIGTSRFNTGLGFFVGRTVAWDYTGSRILLGPDA